MTLKGLHGLERFKEAGLLIGMLAAVLLVAFAYAEMTSFGSYPQSTTGTPAPSPNNIFIHGWSDYNLALLNLTDTFIKNNSYDNYTCNATMCTWYAYLDNDNYTKQRGTMFVANFSKSNVYFNDSEGVWRNVSDLSASQGVWNYSSAAASYTADADTVLLLKFDETNGPYVNDSSAFKNNGTIYGANRTVNEITNSTNCVIGNCLMFDGKTNYVNVTDSSSLTTNYNTFTVEAWVKLNQIKNYEGIATKTGPGEVNNGWQLTTHTSKFRFVNWGNVNSLLSSTAPSTGVWYHVAGVQEGTGTGQLKLYVNGVLEAVGNGSAYTTTANIIIGREYATFDDYYFNGTIDEVKIVNRSLTADEIRAEYYKRWNTTTINYELAGGDGYDSGIRDVQPAGSYWLDGSGNSLDTGLVGYWKFSEGSGATTADASGYGNTGTLTNMNTSNPGGGNGNTTSGWNASGKFGNALVFDGANDYVDVSNSPSLNITGAITIEAWVKVDSLPSSQTIVGKNNEFQLRVSSSGTAVFDFKSAGAWGASEASKSGVTAGNWHHIVATYNSQNKIVYVDGVAGTPAADTRTIDTTVNNLFVGSWAGTSEFTNGTIDEVRIYNRALTPDEIKRLYDSSAIKLKNDFTTVAQSAYLQMNMTNYTGGTLFNTPAEEIKVDGNPISNIYTPANGSHTTYFYDWKQNDWTVWAKEQYGKGLVGWWKFDEGIGATTNDWSGKNNIGTLTNMNTSNPGGGNGNWTSGWNASGKFGNALVFDGANDYVDASASSNLNITDKITVSAWIKPVGWGSGGGYGHIIAKSSDTAVTNGFSFYILNDGTETNSLKFYANGGGITLSAVNSTNLNQWQYVAVTYDRTTLKLYVNGIAVNSTSETDALTLTTASALIGARISGSYHFNGAIDDVKIWNRSLSSEEIRLEYENKIKQGAPDFNDPRFREQFRWKDEFKRDTYPGINITYAMTAQDPFVRTMVDANATGEYGPGEGVVGVWHFNEGSGTTAYDQSGYANTGTLTNMNTSNPGGGNGNWTSGWNASGRFGNALRFDGVNDYVNASKATQLGFTSGDFSMSFWINVPTGAPTDRGLMGRGTDTTDGWFVYYSGTPDIQFYTVQSGAQQAVTSSTWTTFDTWHHIAITRTGATGKIFKDGVQIGTASLFVDPIYNANRDFFIGGKSTELTNGGKATIDEVMIFNRSLSATEIKKIYEGRHNISIPLKFTEPKNTLDNGLILYAPLEEGSGTTTYDYSGYNNTGTLTNMNTSNPAGWNGNGTSGWNTTHTKFGTSLVFDGVNDFVQVSDSAAINFTNSSFTLAAWAKTGVSQAGNVHLVGRGINAGYSCQRHYGLMFSNTFYGEVGNCTGASNFGDTQSVAATSTYTDNIWHFGTFVFNVTHLMLYVDGAQAATPVAYTLKNGVGWGSSVMLFGKSISHGVTFNGSIDEIRVYNRSLSPEEISQLFYIGQTKIKSGNYYYRNTSSESVLWTAQNFKETYRGAPSQALGSLFSVWSNATAKTATYNYDFNSTLNQHFLFSQGYTNSINAAWFNPSNVSLGFSSETLESFDNSTQVLAREETDAAGAALNCDAYSDGKDNYLCSDNNGKTYNVKWKHFYELDGSEEVITLDPETLKTEWDKPTAYTHYNYTGKLYRWLGDGIDLLVTPTHKVYGKADYGLSGPPNNTECSSDVLNTLTTDCDLNALSLDQIGQPSFNDNAKKSVSSGSGEISFASDRNSLYPSSGADLTKTSISPNTTSNSFLDKFDFSFKQNDGVYKSKILKSDINFLVPEFLLKNENNTFVSATSFIHTSPAFLSLLNLPLFKSLPSSMHSCPVSSLLANILPSLCSNTALATSALASVSMPLTTSLLSPDSNFGILTTISANPINLCNRTTDNVFIPCDSGIPLNPEELSLTESLKLNGTPVIMLNASLDAQKATPTLEDYSGMVYDVTVKNHIILVKRNNKTAWSGNSVVNSSLSYYDLQDNDLVLWLKMNDGWGSLNASDASGWGNNGVLTNMNVTGNSTSGWNNTHCKTGFGMCMNFDGVNDYVDVGTEASLNVTGNQLTLAAWVRPVGTGNNMIISKYNDVAVAGGWDLNIKGNTNQIRFLTFTPSGEVDITTVSAIPLNAWSYVVAVYDGTNYAIYINGTSQSYTGNTFTGTINGTWRPVRVGSRHEHPQYVFNGSIDDVKIWRRALSGDEIKSIYESQAEEYPNYFKVDKTSVVQHSKTVSQKYDGGLVGYWKFDEGANTSAGDSSGMGNTGTLTNMNTSNPAGWNGNGTSGWNTTHAKFGNALVFDGVNDYVNISDSASLDITQAITLEAWFKTDSLGKFHTLISKGADDAYNLRVRDTNVTQFYLNASDGTSINAQSTNTISANTWYHIVGTYDGSTAKLYVNAAEWASASATKTINTNNVSLWIGERTDSWASGWTNGIIDDVKIYSRALSPDEVKQHYLQTQSQYYDDFNTQPSAYVGVEDSPDNGLVGYWKFDEASGTSAKDESGLGNTGTWTGTANVTWNASGKFGNAMSFDGVDDYVNVASGTTLDLPANFTFSAWINRNSGADQTIINRAGDRYIWQINTTGINAGINLYLRGGWRASGVLIPTGAWKHLTTVFDGKNTLFYVDGVLQATVATSGSYTTGSVINQIGVQNAVNFFNGTIDEVKIWNRSLSSTEIYNDYIAKNAYFNKRNATANSVAHTIKTIGNQTTIDYNLTDHDSAGQYDYDQRLLKIEGRAGDANPHLNITTHPVTYSPSVATWFNISVEPCAQWCNVTLEANFSGVVANYTLSRGIKNEYYTSLTTPAGITQYRYYVRTSDENWRVTDQYTITPAKATPILGLKQNNSFATGSGLVGYWSFDENTSTVAYDSSGYNNDGTLTGNAKFNTSGRFGNAMFFDGVNANVTVNPSPSLNVSQGLTLMAWIKPDLVGGTGAGSYHTIACKGDAPGQTAAENYCLFIRDDELFFQTNDGSGYASFNTSNVNFAANTWYHVAAAINQSTNLTLFVDGVYRDGTVLSKPITGNPYNLTIGVHRNGWIQTQHFYGLVDEVRIYNYSMSAQEITDSMNATIRDLPITYANATNVTGFARLGDAVNGVELTRNGSYAAYTNDSTLMGWWHFDNDHAADYSGWGNDGTVAGAVNTTGKLRGALQFDGVNDRVNAGAGTNSQVTNQNTIVFWMKGATVEVGDVAVGYGNVYEIGPYFTNTNLRIMINTPKSGLAAIYPGFTITPNAWQQIAVSYDSTTNTTKWYNNGALGGTDTTTFGGAIQLGSEILYFGFGGNANDYYNGTIDDVKIYNRTLTNREIELEYLRGKGEHDELSAAGIYQYNVTYQESQNFTAKNISGVLRLNQGVLSGNLYINGSQANANYVYGQIANATATIGTRVNNEGTLYLLRNGTEVGIRNGANFAMNETLFGASLYNFTAGWVGYNYTFTNITYALTIAKATPVLIISNGTSSLNTSNLVGYWRFESQGSAIDSSGNGKTGTLSTPPPTATEGLFGRALSFIGKDDNSVSLPANLLYGTSGAVSLWLNTRNYTDNSGDKGMLFTGEGGTLDFQLLFVNNTGKVGFNAWTVGIDSGNYIVSNGTWHHVVGTYGDFGVKLYIDSVQVGSSGTTTAAVSNANGFYIGRKRTGYMFNGTIDEVVLFNRSLTADEVQMLYQSTAVYGDKTLMMQQPNKGARNADSNLNTLTYRNQTLIQNDTDLVGYWNLDEGTGNVSYDKSGHGNTGTLTNMNTSNPNGLTSNATSGWNESGRFGYGLKFDGVNDYVDISALRINGFSNFTYSVWVYPLSNSNEARIIDFTGGRATLDINLGAGSKLTFSVRNSTTTTIMPIALPPTNAWTYLAATYDNSTMRIYVNGNLTANAEHRGAVDDPGCCYATTIGGTTGYWNGTIDDVRIYNRTLSSQEIIEMYNQTRPAGYEYYLVNTTGNANYTAQEFLLPLNISRATPSLYAGFNASSGIPYGEPALVYGNTSNQEVQTDATLAIYLNGTSVKSGTGNQTLGLVMWAGISEFNLTSTATANYTGSSLNSTSFTVAKSTPILALSQNNSFPTGSGLVGYWSFDENASATAYDQSGYGNDGTLTSMGTGLSATSGRNTTNCKYGNCLVFDGVNDYVDAGSSNILKLNNSFTLMAWINPKDSTNTYWVAGDHNLAGGTTNKGYYIYTDSSRLGMEVAGGGGNTIACYLESQNSAGTWQHLTGTYDSSNGTIYVFKNGNLIKMCGITGFTKSTLNFVVGRYSSGNTYNFNGSIDEVRIYNYSMSAQEIMDSMNATIRDLPITYANATNVTGFIRLGDNSTSLILDRNGTITGGGHSVVSENKTLLGAGIYSYNLTYRESQNYTAKNITRILSIPKAAAPTLTLYVNGTQASTFWVYGQPTNATLTKTATFLNEGLLRLLRNGTSVGAGGPDNISELMLFGAGIFNYSAIFGDVQGNYTNTSILSNRDVTISQAKPVLIISNGTAAINTSGLIGYWRFEQSNGSAATNDSSGYGNMGTLTNMNLTGNSTSGLTQGRFGNALVFDGVNDYVDAGSGASLNITSGFSLEAWFKTNDNIALQHVIAKRDATTSNYQIIVGTGGSYVDTGFYNGAWRQATSANGIIVSNKWYHIVGTWDGTYLRTYLDGVLVATSADFSATPPLANTVNVNIGRQAGGIEYFNGTIDEVQIWNRSLTADEINLLYQSNAVYGNTTLMLQMPNKGARDADSNLNTLTYRNQTLIQNDTGLVGYWRFENLTEDYSGYANNGNMTGNNATYNASGRFGSSLSFDGTNDFVGVQNSPSIGHNFTNLTITYWANPTNMIIGGGADIYPIGKKSGNYGFYIDIAAPAKPRLAIFNGTDGTDLVWTNTNQQNNTWQFIAFTITKSGSDLIGNAYFNGVLESTRTQSNFNQIANPDIPMTIGASIGSGYYEGGLDEIRMYNRTLGATEITELYNQTRPAGYEYYLLNTTGNANYTAQEFLLPLNITQAVLTGNLYINRTQASQTWKYPNATNATATTGSRINNEGTLYLLRNGTNVGILSGSNFAMNESLLVASIYNYTAAWVGSNYTFTNITYAMTIDKGVTVMTITSSDNPQTYPNTYVIYGAETSSGDADVLYTLLRNGTGVASAYNAGSAIQDTERTGAGPWNYTFVSDAGENYTANSTGITLIQTVNQGTPIINIYLNGSYATGNNTNLTYPNATIVNATYVRFLGNANATLFRNNTMITSGQNENLTLSASFWNYTAWWAGDENYTANATQLNLTILKGSLTFNLYINGTEGSVTYTYPNGTNATATIGTRINNEGAFSLLRNGTPAGILVNANLAMNESILAAGIYNFSANASGFFNYTITDILSGRILTISRGNPNIALFLNGSQADVSSYVYGNPTNATAYRTSILYNNEGTLQLWRNGTSLGSGGPGNISEIITLPAGIHNYSAILLNVYNYTYSNVSYVMTIQKATPILGIATNNTNGSGINSGNVLYLSFDENASSTAYDQSGFGNDATWTGGANNVTRNLTGRFSNALQFDGVNDFVFVSSVPRIISNQSFTAEAWAYPNNITVNAAVLSNSTSQILQIGASNRWQFLDCTSPGFTASISAWTHLAGVYDPTNNTCYLYGDGVLRNATSMSNEMTATKLTIGTKNNAAYFNGTIDEVKIYNYSRSAEEINASARGVWNDIPLQYHAIVNTTGFIRLGDSSAAINLTRNGTRISNGTGAIALNESVLFGAGIYEYNVTYQESQNFTAKNISKILNIIKAPTFATVWFNETNADRNYNRSETINATGFISTPQGFFSWETKLLNLTLNYTGLRSANFTDIGVITGANNTIYNITRNDVPNAYNFTLWFDGDQNYSASFATRIASVYGNLWIGLNNPLQVYYAMNENVTLNVTVRDFLRGDEIPSVNVSMNLTSFWANSFKNAPYYSRNVSMLNFVGGNYSGKYNVTDLHAGNYSLNYTAARDFYRVGRNFTIIYINESANANISSLFVNVSANVTQNQAVLVNGSIDRIGNIEVNGTIDITIRKINPDNVGLVVANASALDTYETIYNSTLVDTGYNVTLVDDDTVNANTWTPSLFDVIVWGEASYDNFFMQYVDDNIWSQVVAGKPLVMTYYGMIKGAVDLNLSTGWGGRFARDVNVKTPHSVTGNYTAINVSEIQDATYNSLFLFDFRGTELADDGTSGRTVIGVNDTNGGRIVVYGPYRANHWTAEAEDIFLRSVYWAIYGTAQTTFAQTQNITVPYTFEDYFNESDGTAEGWNATIGSWIVQNGAYVQTANATANTGAIAKLKNNSYWSDYTVSMRFSMLGGVANNTQIYFRYDGSARYYLLNISSNGEFAFYKNTGSGAENITDASANLITINQDTWYTLNITARENKLDAEIGGLGRINTTDASGTIAGGTIALGTHRSSSRFDNVAIYHHDGGNKRGTHYFKREWPVGTQSPGSYRATATFTYYNTTGNRTILTSSVDFNVTSNLTAQVNITLNSTLLSSKQALAINGNITAGGNLAVTGNFTLSVWNLTHEITNIQNTSRSVTTSSLYTISETWNNYYNVSGNYSVRANYTWNGGSDSQLANFTISYNVSADVNVSVNAPKFNASTNATVNVTVNNPMQVTITTLTIACNVNDYNGLLVASATTNPDIGNRTIGSINAGAVKWNSTQWNVSANNAGTYSVRCNVSDASGVIGFDVRSFDITRLNATLSINANRTGANYTANDAVGVQGNVTAVGGINASGRLAVEVYNASQRIAQVYSASAITGGLNALNITALNIAFLTYRNLTGVYTLNATFNYTNETGSEIVRSSTTQFNISSTTNATLTSTANKASYTTTETATVTTVITSLSNEAITNGNLTVYIFNSTTFTPTYRQYWNSSLSSIAAGGSATQTDTVNLTSFLPGTQYIVANFTFGGQTVNVTSTFTISVIVPTTNLTVKFFVGDATNYMVYTTASGEVTANRTNASSEWGSRWVVSYFNDSVLGLYGTGGGITVSASNTTTEHQINVNGMIRESRIYAIVTQGTRASFQNRAELLDESKFTTQINPSFGYPLREKNILSLKLKYDDIDVQGSETLRKGTYRLRIENNGTSGGKTLIHIKTI